MQKTVYIIYSASIPYQIHREYNKGSVKNKTENGIILTLKYHKNMLLKYSRVQGNPEKIKTENLADQVSRWRGGRLSEQL